MKKYLHRVDSIRGIAILLVLFYHTLIYLYPGFEIKTYSKNGFLAINDLKSAILNINPIGQGWIGVELFLLISGFLIHFIYLQTKNEFNWSEFYSKRFWRIYPPYILVLLFFFISGNDFSNSGLNNFFSHVFLFHNLSEYTFYSINPSFWSIALEVQLYLIYPIYLFIVKYFGSKKTIILLVSITIFYCIFEYLNNITTLALTYFVIKYWFTWAIGAFLAERYFNNKKLFKKPFIWFLAFYTIFFIFKMHHFTNSFIIIPATLSCLTLMEVILYGDFIDNLEFTNRIFKLFSRIGLISYSIYLIHQPYLGYLLNFFNSRTSFFRYNNFISVVFSYIIIILISYSLHKIIELKSIEFGRNIRNK